MDTEKIAGAFNKSFHDYGRWIMFVLVVLVVLILFTIWSFTTQRTQAGGAQEANTAIQPTDLLL